MGTLPVLRRFGWTLHEMLISMTVMGIVLGLVAHASTQQLRFYRGVSELVAIRGQIGSASAVAASVLWDVSAIGGDILAAQDSVLELRASLGAAVSCASITGHVTIPAPSSSGATGNVLAAFMETPDVGDRVAAFFEDSLGATWLTLHVASPPRIGPPCGTFSNVVATWDVPIQEQLVIPPGTALRFSRPLRLSIYRASDGRWYLGAKTWNPTAQDFNTIQPIAGPLRAYSSDSARTGLLFGYRDNAGEMLPLPIDAARVAMITIVSRAQSSRRTDSTAITVALRNRR